MQDGKVCFGVLGCARINRKVIPAIQQSSFALVQSIASRVREKAEVAAAEFKIPKAYAAYEEVLADPETDAVYIPLPNALHIEWVLKAAEAKKHVLCEKPLGINAAEVQKAIQTCKKNQLHLIDGFMWPHHPRTKAIREIVDSKSLGELRHIESSFTFLLDRSKNDIRRTKAMGGGALFDIGCYCVGAILFAVGTEPIAVTAKAKWANEIDLEMTALLEFANEVTATIHFGFNTPFDSTFKIIGSQKTLSVPRPFAPPEVAHLEVWKASELESTQTFPKTNHIENMIDNFSKAILGMGQIPDIHTAFLMAKTIDALYQSARTDRKVSL